MTDVPSSSEQSETPSLSSATQLLLEARDIRSGDIPCVSCPALLPRVRRYFVCVTCGSSCPCFRNSSTVSIVHALLPSSPSHSFMDAEFWVSEWALNLTVAVSRLLSCNSMV